MLRISKKADYAVFLLGAIARQGAYPGGKAADTVVSAHEIARQAGLNKSVVANLLKEFSRHGLLDSVRGLRGGYRLARPPSEISLGQILEVVEGKFQLVDCVSHSMTFPVVSFPAVSSPAVSSPAASSPAVSSPAVSSPAVSSPAVSSPAVSSPAVTTPAAETKTAASKSAAGEPNGIDDTDPLAGDSPADESTDGSHSCSLIGFCPSKQPMRVVHQRISQLFADIHLDELCSMTPVANATAMPTAAITNGANGN